MRQIKLRISTVLLGVIMLLGVMSFVPGLAHSAYAQGDQGEGNGGGGSSKSQAEAGITAAGGSGGPKLETIVRNVVLILSWIVGVAAVIMIVIAGLKYITSSGDAGGIQSAKNTLLYAIVGLLIAIFAQVIVRFVLGRATGGGGEGGGEEETTLLIQTLFS